MLVKFNIENIRFGHEEQLVPSEQVPQKVNEAIQQGNWVTTEKTNGTTETLTKEVPKENWKDVFGKDSADVKSVAVTSKVKGG